MNNNTSKVANWVNGKPDESGIDGWFYKFDPHGEVLLQVANSSETSVHAAVTAAQSAFDMVEHYPGS